MKVLQTKEVTAEKEKKYKDIVNAINDIPDGFEETKNLITNSVREYIEYCNYANSFKIEKVYKIGFSDAIKLFLECNR